MKRPRYIMPALVLGVLVLSTSCGQKGGGGEPIPPTPERETETGTKRVRMLSIEEYEQEVLARRITVSFSEQGHLTEYLHEDATEDGDYRTKQRITQAYDVYGNRLERTVYGASGSSADALTTLYTYDYTEVARGQLVREEQTRFGAHTDYVWRDGKIVRSEKFLFRQDVHPTEWSDYSYEGDRVIRYRQYTKWDGKIPPDTIISRYDARGRLIEERMTTLQARTFINGRYEWTTTRRLYTIERDASYLSRLSARSHSIRTYGDRRTSRSPSRHSLFSSNFKM